MLLYLIRHGQSTDNAGSTPPLGENPSHVERQHSLDSPLTDLGRRQVECAGEWLSDKGIGCLYSSLMVRAIQTGEILGKHLGLPLQGLAHLCEFRTGPGFTGLPRSEITRLFPQCRLPDECAEEGWWDQSIEDENAAHRRAEVAIQGLLIRHGQTEDRVAVVTHGLFGSALLSVMLGVPPIGYKRFLMHNAGISALEVTPEIIRLAFHNLTALTPDKVTG